MSLTPMMQQYKDIKSRHSECILFFRLGDFYEMFFEDAETASKELEITLTGRDCGLKERAPMCGVPFHSAESYISRLVKRGYKVAICEQVEDPSQAKGIVKRDVVRIITPGTVTDTHMLDEKINNYIMSVYKEGFMFGLCAADISTGELKTTKINWGNTDIKLMDEVARFKPSEIVINSCFENDTVLCQQVCSNINPYITVLDDSYFDDMKCEELLKEHFQGCDVFCEENNPCTNASGALVRYILETQKADISHISELESYSIEEFMVIDASTRRNLELTETIRQKTKKGSLLWVIDRTVTSMGGRTLRKWVEQPLLKKSDIIQRLDAVEELKEKYMARMELMELLEKVYDIERLLGRVVMKSANCRDLTAMKKSFSVVPYVREILAKCEKVVNRRLYESMDGLEDMCELIEKSIMEDPPVAIKEGGIIKDGYNEEVDKLRKASTEGREWIARIQEQEKKRTGIKNLKVGFNKVFGYYLEVTKSNYSMVPGDYIRKQTLANCERYITEELKEVENTILGAEEKLTGLEYEIFISIREKIASCSSRIKTTSAALAETDALCSLAETADRENYCRPYVNESDVVTIRNGRHPVVEKMFDSEPFVPNDTVLDMENNRLLVITGPNMAGKSTYMRQTALIVLMAQVGSFVPAESADIGITDRIFTRVGASDDLSSGRSTFMVEMSEVANILENATSRSLLILDEIGRGTSTFDGLSIAWAVIEHINDKKRLGCRTLFATHYHELTELEEKIKGIKNYYIQVEEKGEDIIFLRKIARGGADDSYGIQVARLAGVPEDVIRRAKEILKDLEEADISKKDISRIRDRILLDGQMDLFSLRGVEKESRYDTIIEDLKELNIHKMTPVEAINWLDKTQKRIKGM